MGGISSLKYSAKPETNTTAEHAEKTRRAPRRFWFSALSANLGALGDLILPSSRRRNSPRDKLPEFRPFRLTRDLQRSRRIGHRQRFHGVPRQQRQIAVFGVFGMLHKIADHVPALLQRQALHGAGQIKPNHRRGIVGGDFYKFAEH